VLTLLLILTFDHATILMLEMVPMLVFELVLMPVTVLVVAIVLA
jgi:hypothetical protein